MIAPADAAAPGIACIVDFEFRADPGERPHVWCMAVREEPSGREATYWRDEIRTTRRAPFDTGSDVAVVAYFASAEWGCFKQLGWPMPAQPIDLFAEVRVAFNRYLPKDLRKPGAGDRWGLYDALARYGLETGEDAHKTAMRKLASTATEASWTTEDQRSLTRYCLEDVRHLAALWRAMQYGIDWPQARLRGLYTLVVAAIEHSGIPLEGPLFHRLADRWEGIKVHYIKELEEYYGFAFHADGHFNQRRFLEWAAAQGIGWPLTPTGAPKLDDQTFRAMARVYPILRPLRQTYSHILDLRMSSLPVGSDDRNRFLQSPFATATGRTMPSAAKNIWAQSRWVRGLVRPPKGFGIAVLDWKSQEYCIAAAASGDERMIAACRSGDPYRTFAHDARLVPVGDEVCAQLRAQCKIVALGVTYGMTEHGASLQLDIPLWRARDLIGRHKATYRPCWRWLDDTLNRALLNEMMATKFGWKWRPIPYCTAYRVDQPSARSIQNFHCQATGAEMLRAAAVLAWLAGVEIIHTMHDALMISAPLERFDEAVAKTKECMITAGRAITGFDLTVDIDSVRWPDRYMDKDGLPTWRRTMAILRRLDRS
jgi:hypothetical protein